MAIKDIEYTRFCSLQSQALDDGAKINDDLVVIWDLSHGCDKPYEVVLRSQPPPEEAFHKPNLLGIAIPYNVAVLQQYQSNKPRRHLHILTPCRKCEPCLKRRGRLWRLRARREIMLSTRTWFCTFTVNPDNRFRYRLKAGSWDFSTIRNEIGKDFTKYLKRLRKNTKIPFRYMLVFEKHKDGFPHLHCLIHESEGRELKKRQIQKEWQLGFSSAKLVSLEASSYITKYLVKENLARVRASLTYGDNLSYSLEDALASTQREILDPKALQRVGVTGLPVGAQSVTNPDFIAELDCTEKGEDYGFDIPFD